MNKVNLSTEVPKEIHELMVAVAKLMSEARKATADGFQLGQDLPLIVTASMGDVMAGVAGVEKLGDEWKEDPAAFIKAVLINAADIVAPFLEKKDDAGEQPAQPV